MACPSEATADQADELLARGKALIDDDPELAAEVLHKALLLKLELFGTDAIESAGAHLYYGIAVYEVARAMNAPLGKEAQVAVDRVVQDAGGPSTSGRPGPSTSAAAQDDKGTERDDEENDDDDDAEEDEEYGTDEGEGEGEEGKDAGHGKTDDMQIAWENIERARVLYNRAGADSYRKFLAEAHNALADIYGEDEKFEEATKEYELAVELLRSEDPVNHRRISEVYYKLQYAHLVLGDVTQALANTNKALASLDAARVGLEDQINSLPEDDEEGAAKLQGLIDDIAAFMEEMELTRQSQEDSAKEQAALRESIKNTLLATMQARQGSVPSSSAAATEAAGPSSGAPQLAAPTNPTAIVQDLGVVGRGSKRITLQPMQPPVAGADGGAAGAGDASAPRKRSLMDIMGGAPGGVTTTGFGAPTALGAPPVDAFAKRIKPEAPAEPENS